MKLARKLTVALVVGLVVVLAGNAALRVRRELALFENDSRRDSLLLARTLAGSVTRIWPTVGEAQALDLVEDANQRESDVRIRWVWLDAAVGAPDGPSLALVERRAPHELPPLWHVVSEAESGTLYTYVPVAVPDGRVGAIEVRDSRVNERAYIRRTVYQALATTALLVTLCGGIAMGLGVALVGRPVALLIEQARGIGRGDLSRLPALDQKDEIGELASEMNTMVELLARANATASLEASARIAALEQLRHADRLSTVGQLAAGIAHELGTPLNVVLGRAQLIRRSDAATDEVRQNAAIVQEQTERMATIIRQLLDFARRPDPHKSPESLRRIVLRTASMLSSLAHKASVEIAALGEEDAVAEIDAGQIQQAVTNLAMNGIQAMRHGGTLRIRIGTDVSGEPSGGPERRWTTIAVEDDGEGMTPEVRERVFEPFFTTKPPGEGTGLGLSVAYGIVTEHGGWIDVTEREGGGTRFTIHLPGTETS